MVRLARPDAGGTAVAVDGRGVGGGGCVGGGGGIEAGGAGEAGCLALGGDAKMFHFLLLFIAEANAPEGIASTRLRSRSGANVAVLAIPRFDTIQLYPIAQEKTSVFVSEMIRTFVTSSWGAREMEYKNPRP